MLKKNLHSQKLISRNSVVSQETIELLPIHKKFTEISNEFLQKHSLDVCGWKLEWEKSKKYLGRCYYNRKVITLSVYWALYLSELEITDTILHEVAHALTWQQFWRDINQVDSRLHYKMSKDYLNHGVIWQQFCKEVGAKPIACYNGEIKLPQVR